MHWHIIRNTQLTGSKAIAGIQCILVDNRITFAKSYCVDTMHIGRHSVIVSTRLNSW